MAVRLAILSHRYRDDWDWTGESLEAAAVRLATWRAAVADATVPDPAPGVAATGERLLAVIRERLADNLDAPGAIAAVDEWALAATAGEAGDSGLLVRRAVDALLGVAL
jgi:L-cysteine:1D-myo-inositol 2-amino-2-deoxy-alpha-D-glucopyranoside ligase